MSDEGHAEVLQVVGGQLRQYRGIDRILAKRSFVLLHTEAVEPGRNVHPHPPAATAPHGLYLIVDDPSVREEISAGGSTGEGHAMHDAAKRMVVVDRVVLRSEGEAE